MSIRTITSTVAATIAHLARNAQSPAPLDVVPRTLTRARELVSAAHRVATTSAQGACALLDGTIRFAAYALGYQRTAATSPPRPAQPYTPPANTAALKPEAVPVSHTPTSVLREPTSVLHEMAPVVHAPTPVSHAPPPVSHEPRPMLHQIAPVSHEPTLVVPKAACDRAPPDHTPPAAAPSPGSGAPSRSPTTTKPLAASTAPPTNTQPRGGASKMSALIEAIRVAVAQGATAEQKAIGAQACRTILTALDAEPGKPIVLPGAPKPHPLSSITVDQALDLAIARLTMVADAQDKPTANGTTVPTAKAATTMPATVPVERRGPRIDLVSPPPRGAATRSTPQRTPQRAPHSTRRRD